MPLRRTLLALAPLAVSAALAAPAGATTATESATTTACVTDLVQAERTVAFTGDMRAIPGAARMQMRFVLQTSVKGLWRRLPAPGFGTWTTAEPGVRAYTYTKRVENLAAPARYRARVAFRWLDGSGRVVRRRSLFTKPCVQPDLRPDLVPSSVTFAAAAPSPGAQRSDAVAYVVPLANEGRSATKDFDVILTVNGVAQPAVTVASLAPKEERDVVLQGPRCEPGTQIVVTVDPAGTVPERDESDNVLAVSCG